MISGNKSLIESGAEEAATRFAPEIRPRVKPTKTNQNQPKPAKPASQTSTQTHTHRRRLGRSLMDRVGSASCVCTVAECKRRTRGSSATLDHFGGDKSRASATPTRRTKLFGFGIASARVSSVWFVFGLCLVCVLCVCVFVFLGLGLVAIRIGSNRIDFWLEVPT